MTTPALHNNHQQGFTIVELMVALVISLLASIGIYSVFSQSEAQQRRTAETQDMWQQARIAMTMIERDVRMAGYGLAGNANCTVSAYNKPKYYDFNMGPIESMAPAPSSPLTSPDNSDSLTVLYSSSSSAGLPPTQLRSDMPNSSAELNVTRTEGFQENDLVLIDQPSLSPRTCVLVQITAVQDSALKLQHQSGTSNRNPPGGHNTPPFPENGYAAAQGVNLYNMGNLVNRRYNISTSSEVSGHTDPAPTLMVTDVNTNISTPVARGIVLLLVVYGLDSNDDGNVDSYARPNSASWFDSNASLIRTARVILLARSSLPDKGQVSPSSITLIPAASSTGAVTYSVPADERQYRYQLFSTEIPLRNPILAN
ncbi:PilW family protein [Thermithiobacillus plumbiphilus]|uniref:PilW family protein n=1 Tax=Thermithiobacillus plumbiphilus TaxID=1729899 RepID=A0ABU9DBC4_9PROT